MAITGSEQIGLTLIITEGFGDIAMAERTFDLLEAREGDEAAVNGATQIRAGVMRPEIVIPLTDEEKADARSSREHTRGPARDRPAGPDHPRSVLRADRRGGGAAARAARCSDSGSKARVLEVELDSGESVIVPRANVELIEA